MDLNDAIDKANDAFDQTYRAEVARAHQEQVRKDAEKLRTGRLWLLKMVSNRTPFGDFDLMDAIGGSARTALAVELLDFAAELLKRYDRKALTVPGQAYYANKFGYEDEVYRLIGPCRVKTLAELNEFEGIEAPKLSAVELKIGSSMAQYALDNGVMPPPDVYVKFFDGLTFEDALEACKASLRFIVDPEVIKWQREGFTLPGARRLVELYGLDIKLLIDIDRRQQSK